MDKSEVKLEIEKHIERVGEFLDIATVILKDRAARHDESKLLPPEFEVFEAHTEQLKHLTYGDNEYMQVLKEMVDALNHHYAANLHHPEHFVNGIRGMNLFDILEMFCDWYAAVERHNDGDIFKSIKINKERFGYTDILEDIFMNTAHAFKIYEVSRGDD